MRWVVVICAVLAAGPALALEEARTLEVAGVSRSYFLHAPAKLKGPAPLLLMLHGSGGRAEHQGRFTGFTELADREGFVLAVPQGLNRRWNDGRPEVDTKIDDVGFLRSLLADVQARQPVDPARVFVAGMSNGAIMANRLACDLPQIRAIALVAGALGAVTSTHCKPAHAVGVVIFAGKNDPIMPYAGGKVRAGLLRRRGEVLGAEATAAFWAREDGCAAAPVSTALPPAAGASDGTSVTRVDYPSCTGAPVTLYSIAGGGHTWPGAAQYLPKLLIGAASRQLDATATAWRFFSQFH